MSEDLANETLHCAHCGYSGGMDGMGHEVKEYEAIDKNGDGKTVVETRFHAHCPECDEEFLTVEDKDERD